MPGSRSSSRTRKPALATQILAINSLIILATVVAASAVARLDPVHDRRQALIGMAAILATILVNGLVLRRRFSGLEQLIETMERVDLAQPGVRAEIPDSAADSIEVVRLHQAFNRMLERLEQERAAASSAVLGAQEAERARLARDLHDEANQALTAVLLRLSASAQDAPEELAAELRETQRVATQAMHELLGLARELRPSALDDHGLAAALRTQVDRFGATTGIAASLTVEGNLDALGADDQLVAYRIVQESLSNAARHAAPSTVEVRASVDPGGNVLLRIRDDGCGFAGGSATGLGLAGMRERALLAGGRVDVASAPGSGTTVELRLGARGPAPVPVPVPVPA